ncbi:hypothetical protein [Fibrella forsythiae]|uniref:Uncharacterized protein n=1 Tax=Fibrella forsythiae TaxID=2817061 RepID=A0ABS3JUC0_9BACT|nr:hypothetical protein [Fibrella forsythiae]MBO0952996.1 hypothetical protein [Fibrella forsythiae]
MATFHSLLKSFIKEHIAAPGPVVSPIPPTVIENTQRWQTHFVCPQALATVRRLIDQDMLRWLDRQPTYVPPKLLLVVERLVPQEYGMVVLTHEAWVTISHALVTYEIVQEQLGSVPILEGTEPALVLRHLACIRNVPRELIA